MTGIPGAQMSIVRPSNDGPSIFVERQHAFGCVENQDSVYVHQASVGRYVRDGKHDSTVSSLFKHCMD